MLRRYLLLPLALGALLAFPVSVQAGTESTPAGLGSDGVIYPRNSPEARARQTEGNGFSLWSMLGLVAVLGGAGFYLLKRGQLGARGNVALHQRLGIEETRSLGNKQYLAVATYGERKMLLAVCPGRIDLLCRLDGEEAPAANRPTARETVAE
ncbi:MAG: flagellar biosynthetic protein FliO [Opitutaceae bacterium]